MNVSVDWYHVFPLKAKSAPGMVLAGFVGILTPPHLMAAVQTSQIGAYRVCGGVLLLPLEARHP